METIISCEALPRVWVSFDLVRKESEGRGSFDPDYLTAQLGVIPTQQNRIGDAIKDGKGRRSFARWRVSIGPVDAIDISSMFEELLARLQPAADRLRSLCAELEIEPTLTCTVEPRSAETPDVTFPHDVISWAASMEVTVGVDILLWRSGD